MKVIFIGAGSMAEAIIAGGLSQKALTKEEVIVTNRSNQKRLEELEAKYGISSYGRDRLDEALREAGVIILAMKPKDAKEALEAIKLQIPSGALVISVIAGVSISFIEETLEIPCAVVRAMPNTSAAIGQSATGIVLNRHVTEQQKKYALNLFSAIGLTAIVEEDQIDAVTGLSGSGPAYIYYLVEAMEKAAAEIGLDEETAKPLITQTLLGAAKMLSATGQKAEDLRKAVTSPGGTTEAGLRVLEERRMKEAVIDCIKAATAQSKKLGLPFLKQTSNR
ncbi:MAG: pyrroline-5-carboxylate reductase [Bacillales bacterium]|nr:pyrroline-5-carboxylate reductase [Bacillales bacterium]